MSSPNELKLGEGLPLGLGLQSGPNGAQLELNWSSAGPSKEAPICALEKETEKAHNEGRALPKLDRRRAHLLALMDPHGCFGGARNLVYETIIMQRAEHSPSSFFFHSPFSFRQTKSALLGGYKCCALFVDKID